MPILHNKFAKLINNGKQYDRVYKKGIKIVDNYECLEYTLVENTSTEAISTHLPTFTAINDNVINYQEFVFTLKDGSTTKDRNTPMSNVVKVTGYYNKEHYKKISFENLNDIHSIDRLIIDENITSMERMFYHCKQLKSINMNNWDTSNVTNMTRLFSECNSLESLDITCFNTDKVTSMFAMFDDCYSLTSLEGVSSINPSKVTSLEHMFYNCRKLTTLDLSSWEMSNVKDTTYMFQYCSGLTSLNVSGWNLQNLYSMSSMFSGCEALQTINFDSWTNVNPGYINYIFQNCIALSSLNLSNWGTSSLVETEAAFINCRLLMSLNLSTWDTNKVTNCTNMFDQMSEISVLGWNYDGTNYTNFTLTEEQTGYAYTFPWNMYVAEYTIVDRTIEETETTEASIPSVAVSAGDTLRYYAIDEKTDEGFGTGFHIPLYLPILTRGTDYSDIVEVNSSNILITLNDDTKSNSLDTLAANVKNIKVFYPKDITRILFTGYDDNNPHQIKKLINLTTDNFTSMNHLFYYAFYLEEVNTSNWNTANVTNMDRIFRRCEALRTIDVSMFNTENVSTLYRAFDGCVALTTLDLSTWNTSSVTNMYSLFNGCNLLTTVGDLSNWDTSSCKNMEGMFSECYNLTAVDVSNFDTSNVTTIGWMFNSCNLLTTLDVANWDVRNVTDMSYMFYGCYKLTSLDVSSWITDKLTNISYMFDTCSLLTTLDVSNFNISNVSSLKSVFRACNSLTTITGLENWNTINVTSFEDLFRDCHVLENLDPISNWNTSNLTNIADTFNDCRSITSLDLSKWNTSKVTIMDELFDTCYALTSLNLSNWNTENITDMKDMFRHCKSLTSLDLSSFDTSNVVRMKEMFNCCYSLTSLNISTWNVSNVTDMNHMFQDCYSLEEVDMYNFSKTFPTTGVNTTNIMTNVPTNSMIFVSSENDTIKNLYPDLYYIYRNEYTIDTTKECEIGYDAESYGGYVVNNNVTMGNPFDTESLESYYLTDWGDGTLDYEMKHTYEEPGIYTIYSMNNGNGRFDEEIDAYVSFDFSYKVTSAKISNYPYINFNSHFSGMANLADLDLSLVDTSKAEDIGHMFNSCRLLQSIDLSKFITNNVVHIPGLFAGCSNLKTLNLSTFDTSKVKIMGMVFSGCTALESLDLSNWSIDKVQSTTRMFSDCTALKSLNLSTWNTANLRGIADMFSGVPEVVDWHWDGINYANWTLTEEQTGYAYEFPWNSKYYVEYTITPADDTSVIGERFDYIGDYSDEWKWYGYVYLPESYPQVDTFSLRPDNTSSIRKRLDEKIQKDIIEDSVLVPSVSSVKYDSEFEMSIVSLQHHEKIRIYLKDGSITNDLNTLAKDVEKIRYYYPSDYNIRFIGINNYTDDPYNHNLTSILYFNTSNFTSLSHLFYNCERLTSVDVTNYCTNKVTSLESVFDSSWYLKNITGLDTWDISNVTTLRFAFYGISIESIDLSMWNPNNLTDISGLLSSIGYSLKSANLTNLVTDKVTNIANALGNFKNLEIGTTLIGLETWDTSNVTDMANLFYGCEKVKELDLSMWDTSKVELMSMMFERCYGLTKVNISTWDASNITNMDRMFANCRSLKEIDLYNFTKTINSNCTSPGIFTSFSSDRFGVIPDDCMIFISSNDNIIKTTFPDRYYIYRNEFNVDTTKEYLTGYDANNDWAAIYVSDGKVVLNDVFDMDLEKSSYLIDWGDGTLNYELTHTYTTLKPYTIYTLNTGCANYDYEGGLHVNRSFTDRVISAKASNYPYKTHGEYFSKMANLASLDITLMDTHNSEYMGSMFFGCKLLTTIDVSHFDTSKVTNMTWMFNNCRALTSLIGSENLVGPKVTDIGFMFNQCISLQSLNVSNWQLDSLIKMNSLFEGCTSLANIDTSNWDTRNVQNMNGVFNSCAIETIDVSHFNTQNLNNTFAMFLGCNKLRNIKLFDWESDVACKAENMFYQCSSLQSVDLTTWEIPNLITTTMFYQCSSLQSVDVSTWNTVNVTEYVNMFEGCPKSCIGYYAPTLWTLPQSGTGFDITWVAPYNEFTFDISLMDSRRVDLYQRLEKEPFTIWGDGTYDRRLTHTYSEDSGNVFTIYTNLFNRDETEVSYEDTLVYSISENTSAEPVSTQIPSFTEASTTALVPSIDGAEIDITVFLKDGSTTKDLTTQLQYVDSVRIDYDIVIYNKVSFDGLNLVKTIDNMVITEQWTDIANIFKDCSNLEKVNTDRWNMENVVSYDNAFTNCPESCEALIDPFTWNLPIEGTGFDINFVFKANVFTFDLSKANANNSATTIGLVDQNIIGEEKRKTNWGDGTIDNLLTHTYADNGIYRVITNLQLGQEVEDQPEAALSGINIVEPSFEEDIELPFDDSEIIEIREEQYKPKISKEYGVSDTRSNKCNIMLTAYDTLDRYDRELTFKDYNTSLALTDAYVYVPADCQYMFNKCVNLQTVDLRYFDTSNEECMDKMFFKCNCLHEIKGVEDLDVSNVKYMWDLFAFCNYDNRDYEWGSQTVTFHKQFKLDLSKWDVSKVEEMGCLFSYCCLTDLDISTWDTHNVRKMYYMFESVYGLTSLDLRHFDVSNVDDMVGMFNDVAFVTEINISGWDTSNVVYMLAMFEWGEKLQRIIGLEDLNTSKVIDMSDMFACCFELVSLDLSRWDTSKCTNMKYTFGDCEKLENLNISTWDTSNVTTFDSMFCDCYKLKTIDISNWDTSSCTILSAMFDCCEELESLDLSKWDTSKVEYMNNVFKYCYNLSELKISNWDTSNVIRMNYIFRETSKNSKSLVLDLSSWDVSNVTDMTYLCYQCGIKELNISNWNACNVTVMSYPFYNTTMNKLIANNVNLSKLTSMKQFFSLSMHFNTLELANWDVSNVTDMQSAFYHLDNYPGTLDLSTWKIGPGKLTNLSMTFGTMPQLTTLNLAGWDTSNVTSLDRTFYFNLLMTSLNLSGWDTSKVTAKGAFGDCPEITNWFIDEGADYSKWTLTEAESAYAHVFPWTPHIEYTISAVDDTSRVGDSISYTSAGGSQYSGLIYLPTSYPQESQTALILNKDKENINNDNVMTAAEPITEITLHTLQSHEIVKIYLNNGTVTSDLNTLAKDVKKIIYCYPSNYNVYFNGCHAYECKEYCSRVTNINYFDTSNITSLDYLLCACRLLTEVDVTNWCTDKVTSIASSFVYCSGLTTIIGLDTWDTSNVTDMQYLFNNCEVITQLDGIVNWNTANVTNLKGTFSDCYELTSLDLSNWDVRKVTTLCYTFAYSKSLIDLNLTWQTDSLKNICMMFEGTSGIETLDLSSWNTSNVTDMCQAFYGCESLIDLNLSTWDTRKVTSVSYWRYMFSELYHEILNWHYDGTNYTNWTLTEAQTDYEYKFPWNQTKTTEE